MENTHRFIPGDSASLMTRTILSTLFVKAMTIFGSTNTSRPNSLTKCLVQNQRYSTTFERTDADRGELFAVAKRAHKFLDCKWYAFRHPTCIYHALRACGGVLPRAAWPQFTHIWPPVQNESEKWPPLAWPVHEIEWWNCSHDKL